MISTENITAFDQYTSEYDEWFEKHPTLYQSEILALKKAIPENKKGIEIGVGTGRFAEPFNIKFGVEPSENMARVAEQKGIKVFKAVAESLPIENEMFDFALLVTTVCFLSDIPKAFSEIRRIIKPKGEIIIGLIDKNSKLGKRYEQERFTNKFYKDAHFYSVNEIVSFLKNVRFNYFQYWQTLTNSNENNIEQPEIGFGKGSFVVIKAKKV